MSRAPIQRILQPWWRLTRGLTLGVRAAVADERGQVLLVRHSYVPGWYLPGGGVERRETVGEALARELDEEGGIVLTGPARLMAIYANHRHFPNDHVALFIAGTWQRRGDWQPGREIAEAAFFALDALPPDVTSATRRRLAEIYQGVAVAAEW